MSDRYFTPHGYKRFQDELLWLTKEERPAVTRVVSWAASLGDRSENADYLYAKRRLREIDRRVRFLSDRLDKAQVIDPLFIKTDRVQFGATVTIVDEDGVKKTISIVGVDEIDSKRNYLSFKSPIGASLMGKKIGDEVIVKSPQGERQFEIIQLSYNELPMEEFKGESSVSGFDR